MGSRGGQRWGEPLGVGTSRVAGRHTTLCGGADPQGGVKNVSEFWRVVSGIQQLVARDDGSAGCGGGGSDGTDLGAVRGSGGAKEARVRRGGG